MNEVTRWHLRTWQELVVDCAIFLAVVMLAFATVDYVVG